MRALYEYGLTLTETGMPGDARLDAVVLAVGHNKFRGIDFDKFKDIFKEGTPVFVDVKSIYDRKSLEAKGYLYWSL